MQQVLSKEAAKRFKVLLFGSRERTIDAGTVGCHSLLKYPRQPHCAKGSRQHTPGETDEPQGSIERKIMQGEKGVAVIEITNLHSTCFDVESISQDQKECRMGQRSKSKTHRQLSYPR